MALQVTCLLLVLAITFMHSIFGFFSGIINFFCTVIAVCVSLGFYEALSGAVVKGLELSPGYTEPIVLMLLFILSLSLLRFAADNLIRGNVQIPPWMDWGGAGLFGFLNAQLIVGMLAIGTLMLPLGGSVLMFERYVRTDETVNGLAKFERRSLWTRPDEMTIGLFELLSGGSLKGQRAFATVYPSFADNIFYSTNTVQPESTVAPYRDKKGDGWTRGLSVEGWWEVTGDVDCRYRKEVPTEKNRQPPIAPQQYKPQPGFKLIAVRLGLDPSSGDRNRSAVTHLFRPTMLRVVGTLNGRPVDYVARIIGNADSLIGGKNRLCDLDTNFAVDGASKVEIDAYFEVEDGFVPEFVEYRRHARAALTGEAAKAPPSSLQFVDRTARDQQAAQGATFARSLEPDSAENIRLPFPVAVSKVRGREGVELADGKLVKGRFQGTRSSFEPTTGDEPTVRDFALPPGKKLLQIRWQPRKVLTLVGQVFSFVDQVAQFEVTDDRGETYMLAGYFGIVKRSDNREDFELFLNGFGDNLIDPGYKAMLDFKFLKRNDLRDTEGATIGLLFYVNPGVRIMSIRSGRDTHELGIPVGP